MPAAITALPRAKCFPRIFSISHQVGGVCREIGCKCAHLRGNGNWRAQPTAKAILEDETGITETVGLGWGSL